MDAHLVSEVTRLARAISLPSGRASLLKLIMNTRQGSWLPKVPIRNNGKLYEIPFAKLGLRFLGRVVFPDFSCLKKGGTL